MDSSERRIRLGRFLRSCRERTDPGHEAANHNRRRTPGLRREEVAERSGISAAYYTKIEQGRVDAPAYVLEAIAFTLGLSHAEREYVRSLGSRFANDHPSSSDPALSPVLRQLLDEQGANPAQVINHRWDFLAWNDATLALMADLDAIPAQFRNLVVMMFTEPLMRLAIGSWEENAKGLLAEFRADYGRYHGDPDYSVLIGYLSDASPEFKRWWRELPDVGSPSEIDKVIHHPSGAILLFRELALEVVDHPGLRVLVFLPQDAATRQAAENLLEQWRSARAAGF